MSGADGDWIGEGELREREGADYGPWRKHHHHHVYRYMCNDCLGMPGGEDIGVERGRSAAYSTSRVLPALSSL